MQARLISALLICSLLMASTVAAQPQVRQTAGQPVASDISLAAQPQVDGASEIQPVMVETLQPSILASEFARLRASDDEIAAANSFLVSRGFAAQTGQANFWGQTETYRSTYKGQPTEDTYTIRVQDYSKQGSRDQGAIARVTVNSGGRCEVYSFVLIAPNGNFEGAEEYQVAETAERLDVVRASSWWSCVVQQIKQKCVSVCINALTTCPATSWSAYLGCVATRCGGCFLKASACCTCNCKWWCKGSVGCCHR